MSKEYSKGYKTLGSKERWTCNSMHGCVQGKIQSDGSIDMLKSIIIVRGDLQNKILVGDTCSPTESMRTLKYFLADAANHKAKVHELDLIGSFLQAKFMNRVFVKLDSRYTDYFP